MIKKVIVPTILAGTLLFAGGNANASDVDFETLAQKAQANDTELVQKPIQKGAYDYNFTRSGVNYHFYSDGTHFGYEWHDIKLENPTQDHLTPNPKATPTDKTELTPSEKIDKQQELFNQNQEQVKDRDYTEHVPVAEKVNNDYVAERFEQNKKSQVQLANGNTPGATGSNAAQVMAQKTGVPATTWEHIIAKESNGNPNAHNPSGADGLFQTMPMHGSTATVQDQINSAVNAYNKQGLSAWGF